MIKLKNQEQIDGISRSCGLLSDLFAMLKAHVVPGVSTLELDEMARRFIESAGGKPAFLGYMDFPATLCISINEEVIHGIPSRRTVKPGDLVGIDCGIDLHGYFSDAAFTVSVPPVSEADARLVDVTRACLERAIAAVKPGNRVHDISRAVFSLAKQNGYGVVRPYCGHGVGFSQHEDPQVPNYVGHGPNPRLQPGMVLAIEPMINAGCDEIRDLPDGWTVVTADGAKSAHFEHTVVVTADGCRVLTAW